jgi:hypothetical protein
MLFKLYLEDLQETRLSRMNALVYAQGKEMYHNGRVAQICMISDE